MLTAEQVFAAHKANLDTLFGLTNKAFEGVEKLVELNLQLAKTALGEVAENTQAVLSVKDAQELLSLQAALLQPTAEKAAAYSRHLYDIATSTNSEVTKLAEAQLAEVQSKFTAVVDTAVKNAPAGSENAVALMKSAVAAASNAFESVQKAAKQAADVAEANFQSATNSVVKASQTTTRGNKPIQRLRQLLPPWLPAIGLEGGRINIVPVDFVVAALDHISHQSGNSGRCFHLVDPVGYRVGEVLDIFSIAAHAPKMSLFVNAALLGFIPQAVKKSLAALAPVRRIRRAVMKDLGLPEDIFTFVNYPTRFDCRETGLALKGSGIACPDLHSYAWRL